MSAVLKELALYLAMLLWGFVLFALTVTFIAIGLALPTAHHESFHDNLWGKSVISNER